MSTTHATQRRNWRVKLAKLAAEAVAAPLRRDEALIAAHGERQRGGLTYDELAEATGLSKGRVIQIVQGKSDYSKRQLERRNGKASGG